tara:strand:+ start:4951 stop:6630 length:1680 start_codon:yes stop_codon:yes gene_type:complete
MSIFDWVSDTFGQTKMASGPSVMDEGTKVIDPDAEQAARDLQFYNPMGDMLNVTDGLRHSSPPLPEDMPVPQIAEQGDSIPPVDPYGTFGAGVDGLNADGTYTIPGSTPPPKLYTDEELAVGNTGVGFDMPNYDPHGNPPTRDDGTLVPPQLQVDEQNVPVETPYEDPMTVDVEEGFTNPTDADPDLSPQDAEDTNKVLDTAVTVPDGPTVDQAKEMAAQDPKGWKKAMTWFSDTFGINQQDLAQAALFYAGSRIAGYDHSGSMTFAFNESMKSSRGRTTFAQRLTEGGKHTVSSIREFRKTGDRSKLVLVGKGKENPVKIDFTKQHQDKEGKAWFPSSNKNGDKFWSDRDGNTSTNRMTVTESPKTPQEVVDAYGGKLKNTIVEHNKRYGNVIKDGVMQNPKFKILPTDAGNQMAAIIHDEARAAGISVDAPMFTKVAAAALDMAQADAMNPNFKGSITDMSPYILGQIRYYKMTEPWQQQLMKEGKPLDIDRWISLRKGVSGHMRDTPAFKQALANNYTETQIIDHLFTSSHSTWREQFPDGTGDDYYNWLLNNTSK